MLHTFTRNTLRITKSVIKCYPRCISSSTVYCKPASYDGDGKTKANILNNEVDLGLLINGFSQVGFRLNNNMTVLGPMAIFPRTVLSWNVGTVKDITEESLSLFTILEPALEILVIGIGDRFDRHLQRSLFEFMKKYKMNVEILPTEHACSTFNFLNSEARYVAGAMIPPQNFQTSDDDVYKSKTRYQNLYETKY
ncbi:hypothetical protein RN001_007616 [Aquatica leii]|uniref:NADH dehydrogenase [ubiquinone] 1 alpha subcomplex assembly factor 3 n=1 Tax=Aquatica leii TaxID=1421715 RepID=A0AAN7Q4G4_9COLE|nr:hypothetical protein RN001_007616 [Aquatica leii]